MSRRSQKLIAILCAAIISIFIWYARSTPHQIPATPPAVAVVEGDDFAKYHNKTFTVVKVIDGDTIDVNTPEGKFKTTRIRLIGVDTPETKKPNCPVMYFGPEAAEYTRLRTSGKQITVLLDTAAKPRDRYGRLLAYIKLSDGRIFNEILISEGFGYAYTPYKHSFFNKYQQLQNQARSAKRGLWKNVTPNQMPEWLQKDTQKHTSKKAA